jgi:alpha-glucosidase
MIEAPQLQTTKKKYGFTFQRIMKTQRKRYSVVYMHDAQNLFDAKLPMQMNG